MHLEYQISESDYLAAIRLYERAGYRSARLRLYVLPTVCLLLALPIGIVLAVTCGLGSLLFLPLPILLVGQIASPIVARRRLLRAYRDRHSIRSRNFVDADDDGIRVRDFASDRRQSWQEFSAYAESGSTFIRLQRDKPTFVITPKRELTATQITEFRTLCQAHLPMQAVASSRSSLVHLTVAVTVMLPILWLVAPPLFR